MSDLPSKLDQIQVGQAQPAVTANELYDALSQAAIFGRRARTSNGLVWGFFGGRYRRLDIANGTVTLPASQANVYIVANKATGAVSQSTTTTNWNDPNYDRLYWASTSGGAVTDYEDHREFLLTPEGKAINSQSAAYTTVLADRWRIIHHPAADTTPRTFTIDSNANVPYPLGTELEFINETSAGSITIAITSDTMRKAGTGATGSRTLADSGWAKAKKIWTTEWIITGDNLT
jgi:muramidase (phage lysozyme)